jgi:hypothetical protein
MLSHILSRIAGNCQSKETPQAAACGVWLLGREKKKRTPQREAWILETIFKKICIKNSLIYYGDSIIQLGDFTQFLIGKLE